MICGSFYTLRCFQFRMKELEVPFDIKMEGRGLLLPRKFDLTK